MIIQLNFKSGKPVYLQIVDQIKAALASGGLSFTVKAGRYAATFSRSVWIVWQR
jgi:hypothetical protein